MCYSALQSVCTVWASEGSPRCLARCPNRGGGAHSRSSNSPVGLPWCRDCDCVRSRGASLCAGLPCGVTGCAERREVLGWLLCLRRQPGPALPSGRHRREQRLQRPRLRFTMTGATTGVVAWSVADGHSHVGQCAYTERIGVSARGGGVKRPSQRAAGATCSHARGRRHHGKRRDAPSAASPTWVGRRSLFFVSFNPTTSAGPPHPPPIRRAPGHAVCARHCS